MELSRGESYVIGLDYGSDSCRAVLIDAADGKEIAVSVRHYPRWTQGLYCEPAKNQFRQHPLDYIETLEGTVHEALSKMGTDYAKRVRGIAIDTTGSTPCAVDEHAVPLAMKPEYTDNPSAMFVLWKDHTAVEEAARINQVAKNWGGIDFTRYEGGVYSSEWFWAKIMRVFKEDPTIVESAYSFLEHCDWMPALLTGCSSVAAVRRSRCAMGHKAMWHAEFGGYPADEFFARLDARLIPIKKSLGTDTYTSDQVFGYLSEEWAERLGLPAGIPVAVGAYDAHMGAVGGGVRPGWLVKVMGTSTCDMIVGPKPVKEKPVRGICGQVDGSIIPSMIGYEAGQSSFGDVYAWFKDVLLWPVMQILPELTDIDRSTREKIQQSLAQKIIPALEEAARNVDPESSGIVAIDWLNGRRTPDANQLLKGAIMGLSLGSDAPRVFRALVEATAFGARAIVERFQKEGVDIEGVIGIGGVARKSSFVMQIVCDVLKMPIHVPSSDQAVALGAAIFAAVVAGLYPDVPTAQQKLATPIEKVYTPDSERAAKYDRLYETYRRFGAFIEREIR